VPGITRSCQSGNERDDGNETVATIRIQVIPNARVEKVVGDNGDAIKIKLRARAIEGQANKALVSFLAAKLGVTRRAIVLEHGKKSREKVIRVDALNREDIRRGLLHDAG
jgi:hypothetical protein